MKKEKPKTKLVLIKSCMVFLGLMLISMGNARAGVNETRQTSVRVSGQVVDNSTGETLPGVSLSIKGTNTGTVTDMDGNFAMNVPNANVTLVFSHIGYLTQEIALKGQTSIQVSLREDSKVLDEIVVVGYGTMKRTDVATAISTIKPEDFNVAGSTSRDVRQLLNGKVAGITVTRTGGSDPNSGSAIQMRGVTSVRGEIAPLVVIDGIPGGNIDLLRAEDIESIDVLKDGSAAAIYGSRANAGVIIITTKKGQKGVTQVEYSGFMTKYTLANPDHVSFMEADQYRQVMKELNNPSYMQDRGSITNMYTRIMNKANLSHSHTLSISGGTENTVYRASIYYNNFESIGKKRDREQYGGRMSLESKGFNNMLTFQSNMALNYGHMGMIGNEGWESALKANPTNQMYNEDGSFYEDMAKDENKYARLFQQKWKRLQTTSALDAKITLEPVKDLRLAAFGSITRDDQKDNKYYLKDSRNSINDKNGGGWAEKSSYMQTIGTFEPTVDYHISLAEMHQLNAVAGYSYQYKVFEKFSANNNGFLNDSFRENNLGAGSGLTSTNMRAGMSSEKKDETLIAFFGRLNYVFDSRYIAQFSIRREGSSKFGTNNKWGNFPSVAVAWNITNEEFMKNLPVLSNMKVRVGYGETGNSGIDPYQSVPTLGTGGTYLYPDGTWFQTYGPNKNPNPNLKWETKKEWNFGLDFGVLNNRIIGAIDLYQRKATDLLMTGVQVPSPSNIHSSSTMNVGTISSTGIEFTFNTVPVKTKDFDWRADLIISKIFSNKLDKFSFDANAGYISWGGIGGSGALGDAVRLYEGSQIGNFYGKRFAGFDTDGEWLFYKKDGTAVRPDQIAEEDMTVIGNGQPKWYVSLSNNFTYKNFDASFMFRGRLGFDALNRVKMTYGNLRTLQSGDNVLKDAMKWGINASYQYSDYYIEKGDYLKLDNITIGYTFQNPNPYIPAFRVYATATDLFTLTGYKGYDPEMDDTGLSPSMEDRGRSPITRSFTLGINLKF